MKKYTVVKFDGTILASGSDQDNVIDEARDKMAEANTEVAIVQMADDGRYVGDWYLYQ